MPTDTISPHPERSKPNRIVAMESFSCTVAELLASPLAACAPARSRAVSAMAHPDREAAAAQWIITPNTDSDGTVF